jgi:hypothetical protein
MKKYPVGTNLMVEQGGDGWGLLTGYTVTVIDLEELIKRDEDEKYYNFFTEGLTERTDDVFFVQCNSPIEEIVEEGYLIEDEDTSEGEFVEPVVETLYEEGSVWAISLDSSNAKVYEIKK